MKKNLSLIVSVIFMVLPIKAEIHQASSFGIKSDGVTLNTRSIQAGIDFISAHGGGVLEFSVGRYLTGSIHLKSNVEIRLLEGAVLVGSTNPYDYDMVEGNYGLLLAKEVVVKLGILGLVLVTFLQSGHGHVEVDVV